MNHSGGHLPFEADVTDFLLTPGVYGANRLTVAVNNTLNEHSLPQGGWYWEEEGERYSAGHFTMGYQFDFFNYAGIHR